MKKLIIVLLLVLGLSLNAYAVKEFAERFPTGTPLEVFTPATFSGAETNDTIVFNGTTWGVAPGGGPSGDTLASVSARGSTTDKIITAGGLSTSGGVTGDTLAAMTSITEGGNDVYNSADTPGGELGGTWASPTIDDNVTVTGWIVGSSDATTPAANDNDTTIPTTAWCETTQDYLKTSEYGGGDLKADGSVPMTAIWTTTSFGIHMKDVTSDTLISAQIFLENGKNVFLSDGSRVMGGTLDMNANVLDNATNINATGTVGASKVEVHTTTATDPIVEFKTTNTANEIDLYLDESDNTYDKLILAGKTAGLRTGFDIIALDGLISQLTLYSGADYSYFAMNLDDLEIKNNVNNKDIIWGVTDNATPKTMTWVASGDTLRVSSGLFNFHDDDITTTGTMTAASYTDGTATLTAGNLTGAGNVAANTYGSDGSVSNAELLYINSVTSNVQDQINALAGAGNPTGTIITWTTATPPSGYLECNGAAVSRTTYSGLFAVIGEIYGVGDESTTFNLPDLRGKFARGWDHGAGNDPNAATRTDRGDTTTGDNVGTLQADEFKSHTHNLKYAESAAAGAVARNYYSAAGLTDVTQATGGSETRPINIYLMYCIKY